MYCPDTLQRLNDEEVQKYEAQVAAQAARMEDDPDYDATEDEDAVVCDFCGEPATESRGVLNPADELNGVDGAYYVMNICQDCMDSGYDMEEHFWCDDCGRFFVTHHSWDFLAVVNDYGMTCQKCALDNTEGTPAWQVIDKLYDGHTDGWLRLDTVPGHDLLWEGECSQYGDFPGHTSLGSVADAISQALDDLGLGVNEMLIPVVTFTGQFHTNLAVYFA